MGEVDDYIEAFFVGDEVEAAEDGWDRGEGFAEDLGGNLGKVGEIWGRRQSKYDTGSGEGVGEVVGTWKV
jgi:hypothetical protein